MTMDATPYDLFEHRHRFSAWAAARAAQRGLTSVEIFCRALDASEIKSFVHDHVEDNISAEQFRKLHCNWCLKIVESLEGSGLQDVPFGRAAKLIGVYLKSMVIVGCYANTDLASVAHPPVDRLLLQELAGQSDVLGEHKKVFRKTAWTELSQESYYSLIDQLREYVSDGKPFWHLEQHWKGPQNSGD